ncbi:MAG TPA: hypothetical protein VNZ52_15830 [Candidatus Thermoplasmatota archaeon]|nr:hypothetical protein [Candidatus Thermoplasmatota archaeon]
MRLFLITFLVATSTILPLALAHGPAHEETLSVPLVHKEGDAAIYVVVCRGLTPELSACFVGSGLWQESNGYHGAQTRGGVFTDEDGKPVAYRADSRLLS